MVGATLDMEDQTFGLRPAEDLEKSGLADLCCKPHSGGSRSQDTLQRLVKMRIPDKFCQLGMWSKELTMNSATAPSTFPASLMPPDNASIGKCYIDRLPIELLAAILEEHSVQEPQAPFIDSQVCRRWHETTQIWTILWSRITINSITEHGVTLNRVKTMLERSGNSPLHVNLDYYRRMYNSEPITMFLFQSPAITRIQNLFIEESLPVALQMGAGMPNLRSLQLSKCSWSGIMKLQLGTESFPLLEELVAHTMWSLPHVTLGSPVPLRTNSFSYVRDVEWAKILSECRETLVEVFLYYCILPPPAQIHLPNLKFLALSNMIGFRNDIVAPSLTTFHESPDRPDPLQLPFTFSSITEYACQGTYPSVDDEPFLEERVLPKLERLAFRGAWKGIKEVLSKLVSHPHAVPKLKTIKLAMEDGEDLNDSQWAELEKLFAHTPLSSTLKRKTNSKAPYAPLCLSLVCDSSVVAIYILMPPLGTSVSRERANNITN